MGTTAHVVSSGCADLEHMAVARLHAFDALWSRFRHDSDVARINAARGSRVRIADETAAVLEAAIAAWERTGGLFDPTIHAALVSLGYDRSFEDVREVGGAVVSRPAPGCADIQIDRRSRHAKVRVPAHVALDLGGIAKGYAADLIVAEMIAAGARGACVNVGGDLAIAGEAPTDDGWIVGIEDPFVPGREILRLALATGAIATTSRLRRKWRRGGEELHHVIDPRTGKPADTSVASVTVIAGTAAEAEILAKVAFLDPTGAANHMSDAGACAVVIDVSRRVDCINGVGAYAA